MYSTQARKLLNGHHQSYACITAYSGNIWGTADEVWIHKAEENHFYLIVNNYLFLVSAAPT